MMHKGYVRPTREEQLRIDRMMRLGCAVSRERAAKGLAVPGGRTHCHHIVKPGKRYGHLYTICLSAWYHEAIVPYPYASHEEARAALGATIKDGRPAFALDHDTEWNLWQETQRLLGLDGTLPPTKILPRVVA